MKLSDGEKVIILMLADIQEKLNVQGEFEPEFLRSAIESDNVWGISWRYPGIPLDNSDVPPIVDEVIAILEMWDFIELSFDSLSVQDEKGYQEIVEIYRDEPRFIGFDGNHESEYVSTARFLVEELERFTRFKDRGMDNGILTINLHRRMLREFHKYLHLVYSGLLLSIDQIIAIVNAGRPPNQGQE